MSKRAERRRAEKEAIKRKTVTYNLTQAQLDKMIREGVERELKRTREEDTDHAINTAVALVLTIPLRVLMDHYWKKSYANRLPKFTSIVLEYFHRWENGELDMDELLEDLWEYGGVKLVVKEEEIE